MNSFINSIKEILRYKKIDKVFREIVFFTENNNYSFFFKNIIESLLDKQINVTIISNDKHDIFLKNNNKNLKVFIIDNFFLLQYFFSNINCKNFIMTTPDLGNGIINKSPFTKNYIYIFHSLISTTVAYKRNAFKNYDTFFCPTTIHLKELKDFFEGEKKEKKLIKVGYPKINELKNFKPQIIDKKNKILIAPTWGVDSAVNKYEIFILIEKLLEKEFNIIFRPHPMSFEKDKESINKILKKFNKYENFNLSKDKNNLEVFYNCENLITDWSGSAIEFSLAFKKPSIFLDTDQRIRNEDINKKSEILSNTFENICRSEIGIILKTEDYENIEEKISDIKINQEIYQKRIINFENNFFYNVKNSLEVSVYEILKLYEKSS